MAEKHRLRLSRAGTILNLTSRQQETALGKALKAATGQLLSEFELKLIHRKTWALSAVVERLGKNVIGIRTAMLGEGVVPFVCFGYGADFADGSSILDRVATIAMFGELNTLHVVNAGGREQFNRGSFFFRKKRWSKNEMRDVLAEVGRRCIYYYLAKYGEGHFAKAASELD